MRAIFLILIVAVVALIAAVATGLIDIRQTRRRVAPAIEADDGKIAPRPGQAPAFEVETGSVGVGTRRRQCRRAEGRGPARARHASTCRASKSAARAERNAGQRPRR